MREELKEIHGVRAEFRAEIARFGTKSGYKGSRPIPTVLLRNIRDAGGKLVTDHLWFTVGKTLEDLKLVEGDEITFQARVTDYIKGYRGYREDVYDKPIETDYRLSHPTKVAKVMKEVKQQDLFK